MEKMKIYLAEVSKDVNLREALKILSEEYIGYGWSCEQTIIDLVSVCKKLFKDNGSLKRNLNKIEKEKKQIKRKVLEIEFEDILNLIDKESKFVCRDGKNRTEIRLSEADQARYETLAEGLEVLLQYATDHKNFEELVEEQE